MLRFAAPAIFLKQGGFTSENKGMDDLNPFLTTAHTKKRRYHEKNGHLPNAIAKLTEAERNFPRTDSLRQHAPGKDNVLIIYCGASRWRPPIRARFFCTISLHFRYFDRNLPKTTMSQTRRILRMMLVSSLLLASIARRKDTFPTIVAL